MRIAYFDCFSGISGDMLLGALLDAGVPPRVLEEATAALRLEASLSISRVTRSGIAATHVQVLSTGEPAGHQHPHKPDAATPERSLTVIKQIIAATTLPATVKALATRTFDLLGQSEAKIHNVPIDQIHFHEVGAVDAIVDIVAASAGLIHLQIDQWYASPLNIGGGTVVCAHGTFPVPAPATADLLRGVPIYSAHIHKELVTPTGAALLRALAPTFGPQPAMTVDHIGYGAGTRNPESFPNVLRLSLGTSSQTPEAETVAVLETALDDATPQLIGYVAEQALALGALDVMLTPVIMKKGRPATLLTILCNPADSQKFESFLLRETTTLGIRIRLDRRVCLDRTHTPVATPYGDIRMKVGSQAGSELNATPEFEDCRTAAATHDVPVKRVLQETVAAYLKSRTTWQ